MPRFEKGESGNPKGRPAGSANKINDDIRKSFTLLLERKLPELETWITKVAEKSPDKAVDLLIKISERFVPKISHQEITGADGASIWEGIKFKFNSPESTGNKINDNDD